MNSAHLHLALNHIPVVGIGLVIMVMLIGLFRRNEILVRTGIIGVVLMALLSVPAYLTGEPAEDVVKGLAGVVKSTVETHEEAAQAAFLVLIGSGAFSLAGLVLFRRKMLPRWFATCVLVTAIASTLSMGWAANLGGRIRHPEIAGNNVVPAQSHERHHD